jgi:hypothetical protein
MARKTKWRETDDAPAAREFTALELDRIRELTAAIPSASDGHPAWQIRELERLHKAAGKRRLFMFWEINYAHQHDAEAAYLEETTREIS